MTALVRCLKGSLSMYYPTSQCKASTNNTQLCHAIAIQLLTPSLLCCSQPHSRASNRMVSVALCRLSAAACPVVPLFFAALLELTSTGAGRMRVIGGPTCPVSSPAVLACLCCCTSAPFACAFPNGCCCLSTCCICPAVSLLSACSCPQQAAPLLSELQTGLLTAALLALYNKGCEPFSMTLSCPEGLWGGRLAEGFPAVAAAAAP